VKEEQGPGHIRLSSLLHRPVARTPGEDPVPVSDLVADLSVEPVVVVRVLDQDDDPTTTGTEALLVRDVLDAPVYDVSTARTLRVGEVWLRRDPHGVLSVVGLEVDPRSAWHRLRPRRRRVARPGTRLVPIGEVHLLSRGGHEAQLAAGGSAVHRLDDGDLAGLLTSLPVEMANEVMHRLPEDRVEAAVRRLHPHVSARLDRGLGTVTGGEVRRTRRTAGWRLNRPPIGRDGAGHDEEQRR